MVSIVSQLDQGSGGLAPEQSSHALAAASQIVTRAKLGPTPTAEGHPVIARM